MVRLLCNWLCSRRSIGEKPYWKVIWALSSFHMCMIHLVFHLLELIFTFFQNGICVSVMKMKEAFNSKPFSPKHKPTLIYPLLTPFEPFICCLHVIIHSVHSILKIWTMYILKCQVYTKEKKHKSKKKMKKAIVHGFGKEVAKVCLVV